jgi:hypothetical protein
MKPSSNIPNETKGDFYDAEMFQGLLDFEECPEGTIPIRHEREDEYYEHRALPSRRKNLNLQADDYNHEGTRVRIHINYQMTVVFTCIIMTN